jgi:hypothetical protein
MMVPYRHIINDLTVLYRQIRKYRQYPLKREKLGKGMWEGSGGKEREGTGGSGRGAGGSRAGVTIEQERIVPRGHPGCP